MNKAVRSTHSSLASKRSKLIRLIEHLSDVDVLNLVGKIIQTVEEMPAIKSSNSYIGKKQPCLRGPIPSAPAEKEPSRASVNNNGKSKPRLQASSDLGKAGEQSELVTVERKMKQSYYIPPKFETLDKAKKLRALACDAIQEIPADYADSVTMPEKCVKGQRCQSGFCPVCVRLLRRKLLKFIAHSDFHLRQWQFVTIVINRWTKAPEDYTPFGKLKDHPVIKNLLLAIHRLKLPDVRLMGSIETVFNVMNSDPVGKPFHLHLMVSGVPEKELRDLIKRHVPDTHLLRSIRFERVGSEDTDIPDTASYVCKQPFWRKSKNGNSGSGWYQTPKATDFAELMCNFGTHDWVGRFFFIGMKFHYGKFKLT